MIHRQRKAILLVALACLVVLVCTAQRMASLHALTMNVASVSQTVSSDGDAPVTPCELSAKSLLASPPVLFEGALFAVALLLAVLGGAARLLHARLASPCYLSAPIAGASTIVCLP